MIKNFKNKFVGGTVRLDNNEFINCSFEGCILEFSGEGVVSLVGCKFSNVTWAFVGSAENTLRFLRGIYHGMGEGGTAVVESIFSDIRRPDGGQLQQPIPPGEVTPGTIVNPVARPLNVASEAK
jgi:hypothetical protein